MLHFTLRCIAKTDRFVCFTLMILSLLVKQSLYKIRFHHDESTIDTTPRGFHPVHRFSEMQAFSKHENHSLTNIFKVYVFRN